MIGDHDAPKACCRGYRRKDNNKHLPNTLQTNDTVASVSYSNTLFFCSKCDDPLHPAHLSFCLYGSSFPQASGRSRCGLFPISSTGNTCAQCAAALQKPLELSFCVALLHEHPVGLFSSTKPLRHRLHSQR